jgi:hypothetical protein
MTGPAPDTELTERLAAALLRARYWSSQWMPERDGVEGLAHALLPVVQAYAAEKAAEALNQTADAWQWGAWADTPRHADRVADRIGAAQYVTDWLRARAQALRTDTDDAQPVTPPKAAPKTAVGADCGHHSWAGLMALLDEHWPDDIFPTRYEDDDARDAGARIVSLMRWVRDLTEERDAAQEAVERVEALADQLDHDAECTPIKVLSEHCVYVSDRIRAALDGSR